MSASPPRRLLITGTDTDVGKTVVTASAARLLREEGRRVGVYKPACSGRNPETGEWDDLVRLSAGIGGTVPSERICPQRFDAPLAPPVAGAAEGRTVSRQRIHEGLSWWDDHCEILLVEGVGGLACPLWEGGLIADFAAEAALPLVIVAHAGLGTINHTLLTIDFARTRGLEVRGVVLNETAPRPDAGAQLDAGANEPRSLDPSSSDLVRAGWPEYARSNAEQIASYGGVPVLAFVPWASDLSAAATDPRIDWFELARVD